MVKNKSSAWVRMQSLSVAESVVAKLIKNFYITMNKLEKISLRQNMFSCDLFWICGE